MSRRVIPMGDFTKDSTGRMGRLDRIGAAHSSDPIRARRTHDIPLCRESHSRELHWFSEGTSLHPTPHNHIKN